MAGLYLMLVNMALIVWMNPTMWPARKLMMGKLMRCSLLGLLTLLLMEIEEQARMDGRVNTEVLL